MKTLQDYVELFHEKNLLINEDCKDASDSRVSGITYNSGEASWGTLFFVKGASFKEEYLIDAVKGGIIAYVSEKAYERADCPCILVRDIRSAMAEAAKLFYELPKDFSLIAITGTKGKTTTAYFLREILDEYNAKNNLPGVAFISTIETYDGEDTKKSRNTTPEAFELYGLFKKAYDKGIRRAVAEFSSQALKYKRVEGIPVDTAVFLNISPDHISPVEHPSFSDYFHSKLKIFSGAKRAVISADSESLEEITRAAKGCDNQITTFGFNESSQIKCTKARPYDMGTAFSVMIEGKEEEFILNMPGVFNVENALAAITVAHNLGIPIEDMKTALRRVQVPGHFERAESQDKKIQVIVDYAHNGLSFKSVIETAREIYGKAKYAVIFGCPGEKALNRRRDMGEIADEFSDYICITSDDPAGEGFEKISEEIGKNIKNCPYDCIEDREEAIKKVIGEIKEKTVVLILGKGYETTQKTKDGTVKYASDICVAREAIKQYNEKERKEL